MNVLKKQKRKKNKELRKSVIKILGFRPKKLSLYILALTHKSVKAELQLNDYENNERLEFLGDAVLDTVISELLYKRFPTADEGFLTNMRMKIVNGKKLSQIAFDIGLDKLLFANTGKNSSYRIYEDALEAFIGAIYVDRGYKYAKRFISRSLYAKFIDINELKHKDTNYKSRLIEWTQKNKIQIHFETESKADDNNLFHSKVLINEKTYGLGKGFSKKEAEQDASASTLKLIEEKQNN